MSAIRFACISPHPPIIIHEVGRGREAETSRTIAALQQVATRMAEHRPETVVLVSPHGPLRPEAFGVIDSTRAVGTFADWGAPGVVFSFETDRRAADLIVHEAQAAGLPVARLARWGEGLDWGCTVPLYYLQHGMGEAKLVTVAISFLSPGAHFEFGKALARALGRLDRRVAFISSADLSHALKPGAPNGYHPAGRQFDERYQQAVANWDVDWVLSLEEGFRRQAAEDAIPQTAVLMGALSGLPVTPRVLSYEGPFGVGYLVAAIDIAGVTEEEPARTAAAVAGPAEEKAPRAPNPFELNGSHAQAAEPSHPFVRLARDAVEAWVRRGEVLEPEVTPALARPAGVFVSIKRGDDLRGCIGSVEPTEPDLAREIVRNAIASASRDPRFEPVTEEELPELSYSVDVLTE